jgi:hypothetical protein
MGLYLGLLLVSLTLTAWVAVKLSAADGLTGVVRQLTEASFYLVTLPFVIWLLMGADLVAFGAVALVLGGVYAAHRAILAFGRRRQKARPEGHKQHELNTFITGSGFSWNR